MAYLGDYAEDYATLNLKFTTRQTTGAPFTLGGTPVISVYKANDLTQSTAGITLTADFDSVTGLNNVLIDLSADAFYAVGNDYQIVITTGTVNSVSVVGEVVGEFSIENRYDQQTADHTAALADIPTVAEFNARTLAAADYFDPAADTVANVTTTANLTTNNDKTGYTATLATTQPSITWQPQTITAGDAIPNVTITGTGTADGFVFTRSGAGDLFGTNWTAEMVAAAASAITTYAPATEAKQDIIDANVDLVLVDTDAMKGATFSEATDSLEAIRDRGDTAWTTGAGGTPPQLLQNTTIATLSTQTSFTLTAGSADNDAYNNAAIIITDSATSTQKAVALVSDYVGATKTITLSADPAIFTMAAGDTVDILANIGSAPTVTQITADMDANSTQLAAIVADTNELQTDDVPALIAALNNVAATDIVSAGAITTLTGAVVNVDTVDTCTTNTDMRGTDSANTTAPDNAGIAAILVDTATTIPATLASLATAASLASVDGKIDTIDALVDAILVDTGTDIPALITTLDTVADAIKVKTDQLTFTKANELDANAQSVNGVTLTGDGSTTPFDVV